MEADGVAVALEDDDLGVVEEPLPGHPLEEGGGTHERAQERMDRGVEDELGPHGPRPGEHHDEEPERPLATRHRHPPDVGPVDLACSPMSGSRRRNASRRGAGRTCATCSRNVRTLPGYPRARIMSCSRVARSRGYCARVSSMKAV